jgi:hypothetical protein
MFRLLRRVLERLFGPQPGSGPPVDPYAGVPAPRRKAPGGRGSAIAVPEPDPDHVIESVGVYGHSTDRRA